MKVIIQCASRKSPAAGKLHAKSGRPIIFAARPDLAPSSDNAIYRRPDDPSDEPGQTWRDVLVALNKAPSSNSWRLMQAINLYDQPIYSELKDAISPQKLYVLSAGWGLIRSDFLTPYYDITFSSQAEPWKRRRPADRFKDLNLLPAEDSDDLFAFCTPDYHPLLEKLCATVNCRKILFRRTGDLGTLAGFENRYYSTTTRTNWHYECARQFIAQ